MTAQPTAYIRRSIASRADPGDISREFQTEAVRRLAGEVAFQLRIIDQDWGRSAATDKTDKRLAFLALLDGIEAGAVSHLYAYSPDRLARSVEWSARLVNACRRAGVPITTTAGTVGPDDSAARAMFHMLAVMNENALDGMEAKARATVERRKARNLEAGREATAGMGRKPYGPETTAAVLAAFRETGSCLGAAKALTAAGVPSLLGGRPNPRANGGTYGWSARTVSRIVAREAPQLIPPGQRRGARTVARHRLSGLLRCSCGRIMSTMPRNGNLGYYCHNAHVDASHPRPYVVGESKLLPAIMAEAALLRAPKAVEMESDAAQREDLAARRVRVLDMYESGLVDKADRDRRLAAVAEQFAKLDAAAAIVAVPEIDWTKPPETINKVLRLLWERVELGPDLMFVRAAWKVPEWRAS